MMVPVLVFEEYTALVMDNLIVYAVITSCIPAVGWLQDACNQRQRGEFARVHSGVKQVMMVMNMSGRVSDSSGN
jgi:hypothetical protein